MAMACARDANLTARLLGDARGSYESVTNLCSAGWSLLADAPGPRLNTNAAVRARVRVQVPNSTRSRALRDGVLPTHRRQV